MGRDHTGAIGLTALDDILAAARDKRFLGPGPVSDHRLHAAGFARAVPGVPDRALDLGSGGGVPGLVLADAWPTAALVLLDSELRRAAFLEDAVRTLGWTERIRVVHARAEDAGRDEQLRGSFDVVTARSFGKPAVTAECGAPFLRVGGILVVSNPPEGPADRWPATELEQLGLVVSGSTEVNVTVLRQTSPCPERFPRRPGVPTRRPLF